MQFLPLALSFEWLAANAVFIASGTTTITLFVVYLYRKEIEASLRRRKIGVTLGLIEPYEQDALIRREHLETLLNRLEKIFKRTKTRSERLPRLEAFGIDPDKALTGREQKFSLILDQIRRIALHVTNLEDMNEILEIRTMLGNAVKDLGMIQASDEMAVDNQAAIQKLNEMVSDIDDAMKEIEHDEEVAMAEKHIPEDWLLKPEGPKEEEVPTASREPLDQALQRISEQSQPVEMENDDEEEPPQREQEPELV